MSHGKDLKREVEWFRDACSVLGFDAPGGDGVNPLKERLTELLKAERELANTRAVLLREEQRCTERTMQLDAAKRERDEAIADAKHVRQANENYRRENEIAVQRAETAERELAEARQAVRDAIAGAQPEQWPRLQNAMNYINAIDAAKGDGNAG